MFHIIGRQFGDIIALFALQHLNFSEINELRRDMNNQTIIEQYKEYANCIVGTWHNEKPGEVLTFHLLENIAQEAYLLATNDNVETKATYNIYMDTDERWYLQTYVDGRKHTKYCILVLSPNVMALAADEYNLCIYMRKVDYSFVYDLIDKL